MAIYCVYWRASGWNESTLGRPHTGSTLTNATKSGITAGDTIYPVSYMRGQLLVLGRFVVQMITDGEKPVWPFKSVTFMHMRNLERVPWSACSQQAVRC